MAAPQANFVIQAAVGGGHIKPGTRKWKTDLRTVDEKYFFHASKSDPSFKRFVNNEFAMVDAVVALRNDAFDTAVNEKLSEGDPMGDADSPCDAHGQKRKRKDMADDVPATFNVVVKTDAGNEFTVQVLSDWNPQSTLWIELSQANLDVLLMKPDPSLVEFAPLIDDKTVKWWASRHCVYCRYYDVEKKKIRFHSLPVPRSNDHDFVQRKANEATATLAQFCKDASEKEPEPPTAAGGSPAGGQ